MVGGSRGGGPNQVLSRESLEVWLGGRVCAEFYKVAREEAKGDALEHAVRSTRIRL